MKRYLVKPGDTVDLSRHDPNDTGAFDGDKRRARKALRELNTRLEGLQELLYAQHEHKVLVVLQATDTGGKDGTIRHVFEGVNPQGVKVAGFKVPTPEELDHDYLWRIHRHTPAKGEIVIFNRSHYEDVLVVRVHGLVPPSIWRRRYRHIREFERMLAEEGTTIVKFFLHIDRKEQKERLLDRLNTPEKQWKFRRGDLQERGLWDEYAAAYAEAIAETSTERAPWYIIPSNHKWYRNWVISRILIEILEGLNMTWPVSEEDLTGIVVE
jgi:PPK2 family polyphosphate:nucleotide phosphotransferase